MEKGQRWFTRPISGESAFTSFTSCSRAIVHFLISAFHPQSSASFFFSFFLFFFSFFFSRLNTLLHLPAPCILLLRLFSSSLLSIGAHDEWLSRDLSPPPSHSACVCVRACVRVRDNSSSCTCASSNASPRLLTLVSERQLKLHPRGQSTGRKQAHLLQSVAGSDTRGHLSDRSGRNQGDMFVLLAPPVRGSKRRWLRFPAWNQRRIKVSIVCLSFFLLLWREHIFVDFQLSRRCQRACLHLEQWRAAVCQTASIFFLFKGLGSIRSDPQGGFWGSISLFFLSFLFFKESLSFEYKVNCSAALITIHFLAHTVFKAWCAVITRRWVGCRRRGRLKYHRNKKMKKGTMPGGRWGASAVTKSSK